MGLIVATLTGDVVNSTELTSQIMIKLNNDLKLILAHYSEGKLFKTSDNYLFYRGDSFQIIISSLSYFFEIALKLRLTARIHDCDVRISIGIGELEEKIENINQSIGTSMLYSGRGMESIGNRRLLFSSEKEELNEEINLFFGFIDIIFEQITKRMAQISLLYLEGKTQKEISQKFNISQSAVSQSLNSSNIFMLIKFSDYIRRKFEKKKW